LVFRKPPLQLPDLLLGEREQIRVGCSFRADTIPQLLCETNAVANRQLEYFGFEVLQIHGFASGSGHIGI
jgi:hypothetical protein